MHLLMDEVQVPPNINKVQQYETVLSFKVSFLHQFFFWHENLERLYI